MSYVLLAVQMYKNNPFFIKVEQTIMGCLVPVFC